jgi:hypothetical protein
LLLGGDCGQRQRPVEQRAADDGSPATRSLDSGEVGRGPDSARSEHRQTRGAADLAQEIQIRPTEHPVALDRGAQDPRHTGLGAAVRDFHGLEAGVLEPPASRDTPAADVDRDDEPVTELGDELFEGFRIPSAAVPTTTRAAPAASSRSASAPDELDAAAREAS